jgi:DNA polymerase-4
VTSVVDRLRDDIAEITGGLTASVGVASSKFMAKIASELNKPDGVFIVTPGSEAELIGPMQVTVMPGVGPATAERLRRLGVGTVSDLRAVDEDDLIRTLGQAHGTSLWNLSRGIDHRPVVAERETKSLSVEDTFEHDVTDRTELAAIVDRMARRVTARLQRNGWSGRTVTLKARRHDFETLSRSATLAAPTDSPRAIIDTAERLLTGIDVAGGLRLIGVGISGLTDWVQPDLFEPEEPEEAEPIIADSADQRRPVRWTPGLDVHHAQHGDGWVWGSGLGRVTVRFETRETQPGPVMTFAMDDPDLTVRAAGGTARDDASAQRGTVPSPHD